MYVLTCIMCFCSCHQESQNQVSLPNGMETQAFTAITYSSTHFIVRETLGNELQTTSVPYFYNIEFCVSLRHSFCTTSHHSVKVPLQESIHLSSGSAGLSRVPVLFHIRGGAGQTAMSPTGITLQAGSLTIRPRLCEQTSPYASGG